MVLSLLSPAPHLSWDALVDTGTQCNKSAMIGGLIKE
jgi:hypothetical protein